MKIPGRLLEVASYVIANESMADIGSDHALLPCYLVSQGMCPRAIIGELTNGPYQRACRVIKERGLAQLIEVRQGDGLEILWPGEVSTLVLAGMGGRTITNILESAGSKVESFKRLVVQPMNALPLVRSLAGYKGWIIEQETVVKDEDYYVTIVMRPKRGKTCIYKDLELELGPIILERNEEPIIRDYLSFSLHKMASIIAQIPEQGGERAQQVKLLYQNRKQELEEILKCRLRQR